MDGFEVLKAPTAQDVSRQLKTGSGVLRVVRDTRTGDLYTWDAEHALHEEAIRRLGLGDYGENMGQIQSIKDFERLSGKG